MVKDKKDKELAVNDTVHIPGEFDVISVNGDKLRVAPKDKTNLSAHVNPHEFEIDACCVKKCDHDHKTDQPAA